MYKMQIPVYLEIYQGKKHFTLGKLTLHPLKNIPLMPMFTCLYQKDNICCTGLILTIPEILILFYWLESLWQSVLYFWPYKSRFIPSETEQDGSILRICVTVNFNLHAAWSYALLQSDLFAVFSLTFFNLSEQSNRNKSSWQNYVLSTK